MYPSQTELYEVDNFVEDIVDVSSWLISMENKLKTRI